MSNLIGLGVLKAVQEKGLTIPNDISLIIFDDQPYVSYLNPPISTVKQNSQRIGELAIESILKQIDNLESDISSEMIPVKVIERDSILKIK